MGDISNNAPTCPVCDGKKYTLVATKKVNQTQTVFERQDCHLCVAVDNYTPAERIRKNHHLAAGKGSAEPVT